VAKIKRLLRPRAAAAEATLYHSRVTVLCSCVTVIGVLCYYYICFCAQGPHSDIDVMVDRDGTLEGFLEYHHSTLTFHLYRPSS
jgi:hypothetical protein